MMENDSNKPTTQEGWKERHSRILAAAGIILFVISLVNGFLIQATPLKHLALSAHTLGLMGATFLIALAAYWRNLNYTKKASTVAVVLAIYSFCGGWLIYFTAAATGTGTMFPIASGGHSGSLMMENLVSFAMLTFSVALFSLSVMLLRGLRIRT